MTRDVARRLARLAQAEIVRARGEMRIPGHPRPFYVAALLRDEEHWRIQARYGSLLVDTHERRRNAYVDVRVGSYRRDHVREGGLLDNEKDVESYNYVELPFGRNDDGVRYGLWRLTDARYREAVESLLDKQSHALNYLDPNRHLPAFERRTAVVDDAWTDFPAVEREAWVEFVERVSRGLRRYEAIKESHVEFEVEHICRIFVDSTGSRRVQTQAIWSLDCYLWLLADDGTAFPWNLKHIVADPSELPDRRTFEAQIRRAVGDLQRLAAAPVLRSYSGPVLLEPGPAGLLVHEAIGHRLEGTRLLSPGEGQTFRDAIGRRILPPFLSVYDDPRLPRLDGRSLVGHYRFDDEGVDAGRAELVRDGKLVGFLTTRTGLKARHRSNGHARGRYHQRPISRMGVLCVEAEGGLAERELRERFLEEIRRRGASFGIRVLEAMSGETATDAYNFQAFLGEINLATRVFPDGREELIRGVNFVGTPLNAVRNIVAAGRRLHVDNAFCGAESGYVPVTTVSPALILSELELQGKPDAPYTPFSRPLPWKAKRASRR